MLVSPCPPQNRSDDIKYVHLAKFMREGPPEKIEDIWKRAAEDLRSEWRNGRRDEREGWPRDLGNQVSGTDYPS